MSAKNPNIDKAYKLYKQGMSLVEIASQLNVPQGTVRSWKNRYKWDDECNATKEKKTAEKRNVAKEVARPKEESKKVYLNKYEEWLESDNLIRLEAWARDGLTDEQIAHNMGIRRETLIDWKKKHPNIYHALKRGKEVVDIEVENALLKRALGYAYVESKTEVNPNGTTKTTTIIKEVIPDVAAQIIWLKNRRPDKWREKQPEEESAKTINLVHSIPRPQGGGDEE